MNTHRHSLGHEHELEPQHGLPEALPADERILWQGSPVRRRVAFDVFHLRAVAAYFVLILALRFALTQHDGASTAEAFAATSWAAAIFGLALAILWALADLITRTTVYTITDRRVVMRIGIVLSLTFNLPFSRIVAAQARRRADGSGDLLIELMPADKIAYVHLWPHARAWYMRHPQPALRCLAAVDEPARLLTEAWLAQQRGAEVELGVSSTAPTRPLGFDPAHAA